jgi:uncharacterized protein YoxC
MNELQEVADGDLTVQATVSEDITGAIADSVNYTVEELRGLVERVTSTAARVTSASNEAQNISNELLSATQRQSRQIQETGQAVLEMAVKITDVSKSANESAEVARQSVSAAEQGTQAVENAIKGMNEIREQIQETSKRIKRLGESSLFRQRRQVKQVEASRWLRKKFSDWRNVPVKRPSRLVRWFVRFKRTRTTPWPLWKNQLRVWLKEQNCLTRPVPLCWTSDAFRTVWRT